MNRMLRCGAVGIILCMILFSCSNREGDEVPAHLKELPAPNFKNNQRIPQLSSKMVDKPMLKKAPRNEKWKVNATFCRSMQELISYTQAQMQDPIDFDIYQNRLRRKVKVFPSLLSENQPNEYLERYMIYVSEMVEEVNGLNIEQVLVEFQEYEEYFTF